MEYAEKYPGVDWTAGRSARSTTTRCGRSRRTARSRAPRRTRSTPKTRATSSPAASTSSAKARTCRPSRRGSSAFLEARHPLRAREGGERGRRGGERTRDGAELGAPRLVARDGRRAAARDHAGDPRHVPEHRGGVRGRRATTCTARTSRDSRRSPTPCWTKASSERRRQIARRPGTTDRRKSRTTCSCRTSSSVARAPCPVV